MLLITLIVLLWNLALGASTCNEFVAVSECVCPGQQAIYQCSVMGGVFTVYEGSAFECFGREISLRNSDFTSIDKPVGGCNSDQISISGRGLSYDNTNNCYTSQLNITLSEGVTEKTITCAVDHGPGGQQNSIGNRTIAISTRPLAPPNNITVTQLSHKNITFAWEHVSRNCPSISYNVNISSSECGTCLQRTEDANITCANFSVPTTGILMCTLMIQTEICGGTNAVLSGDVASVQINLKVPDPPELNITAYYNEDDRLERVTTNITMAEPFYILLPGSIDLSPTSYTIRLHDPSGVLCSELSVKSSSQSCSERICSYDSSDVCPFRRTNITVFATNILGNGMASAKPIDYENNFVRINFPSTTESVTCTFIDQTRNSLKTCEIRIYENGNTYLGSMSNRSSDNVVIININGLLKGLNGFFYSIIASDGTKQVIIRGRYDTPIQNQKSGLGAGATAVIVIMVLIIAIVLILFITFMMVYKYYQWYNIKPLKGSNFKTYNMVREDRTVEEFLSEIDEDCDLSSVYYEPDKHEKLLPSMNMMVKNKNTKEKKLFGVKHNKLNFVDKRSGKVLPAEERKPRFRNYCVYFQCKSGTQVL